MFFFWAPLWSVIHFTLRLFSLVIGVLHMSGEDHLIPFHSWFRSTPVLDGSPFSLFFCPYFFKHVLTLGYKAVALHVVGTCFVCGWSFRLLFP